MNNEFLPAYKVYQQVIDLELYYAFVDLVVHTSQEEKAWEIYRNIVDTQIWQQKAEGQNYFEAYTRPFFFADMARVKSSGIILRYL